MVIDVWSGLMLLNLVALLALAAVTTYFVSHSGSDRRLARTFLILELDLAVWTLGSLGWYLGTDPVESIFWLRIYFAGIALFGPVWLAHSFAAERLDRWLAPRPLALLAALSFLPYLGLLTNDAHGLFYSSVTYVGNHIAPLLGRGPLFWLLAAVTAVYAVLGLFIEVRQAAAYRGWQRQYRWLVVVATTPAMLAEGSYAIGLLPLPADPIALMISPVAAVCAFYLFHHWLSDIVRIGLADAARQMGDAIVVLDTQGLIVDANPAFSDIVHAERHALIGHSIAEVVGDLSSIIANIDEVMALYERSRSGSGGEADGLDLVINGTPPRIYRLMMWPTLSRRGSVLGRIITLRDITETRQMEDKLRRAQRMETAGRIAGQVAHDFNNLLGPMIAYPDLIKMHVGTDGEAVRYCDEMMKAAERMAEINQDMLALSRRGNTVQRPTAVDELVQQVVADMRDRPPTLKVTTDLAPDLPTVSGSSAQLLRVITNLVSNAREAMDDSGWLAISTESLHLDGPLPRHREVEAGDYVRITVGDTGCGIPAEIQDRIFDAFFTTKTATKKRGSGLGLSIVQAIVEDHRGYLELESTVGRGTSISVYLPACREAVQAGTTPDVRGGSERILVVDDDPLQGRVAAETLRKLGYQVLTSPSGEEAIAYLRDHRVDMLILDMIMPGGIDGVDAYRHALAMQPGLRAVMLSGFAETDRVAEAKALGAGAFLRKPISVAELAASVRAELERQPDSVGVQEPTPPAGR